MNPYKVCLLDVEGQVVAEQQVVAQNYVAVLRRVKHVAEDATRIEVYKHDGERAGEIGVDYWRQKVRHM